MLRSNDNLYINLDTIEMLKDSFNKEIENLTELFLELMNEVKIIETSDMWSGKSYDSFKTEFETWKLDYLEGITKLLQLKQYLEEVKAVGESLISERNSLTTFLEVLCLWSSMSNLQKMEKKLMI